jgi:hypothetical protein
MRKWSYYSFNYNEWLSALLSYLLSLVSSCLVTRGSDDFWTSFKYVVVKMLINLPYSNALGHEIRTVFRFMKWATVAQSVQCLPTDSTTGVRSPTEAEDFSSSLCVRTGSGAHPASRATGTGYFSGGKGGRGVMLTTHSYLVSRLRRSRSYTSSRPKRLRGV